MYLVILQRAAVAVDEKFGVCGLHQQMIVFICMLDSWTVCC